MQKESFTVVPLIAIHPDRITYYKQVIGQRRRSHNLPPALSGGAAHRHGGSVSVKASRKIQRAITYLCTIAKEKPVHSWQHQTTFKFRLAFITLTLPSKQKHTDSEIMKRCFHQFLVEAKKKWNMHNYVWRAERQKNGNIHFHILVDRFVPWSELRDTWNRVTNKLGYVNNYRDEMRRYHNGGFHARADLMAQWSYKKQIKAYHEGVANDWSSPNSTDVHAVRKVKNIKAYVCKYMLKSSQADAEISRLWGCSYELSRAKGCVMELDSWASEQILWLRNKFKPEEFSKEHFSVMFIDWFRCARSGIESLADRFAAYMLESFQVNIQMGIIGS